MTNKIERQVHHAFAQIFDPQDSSGDNNTWIYDRAPDGYLFQLLEITVSPKIAENQFAGIVAIFDGHEYTNWNIWPGVQSQETLWRGVTISQFVQLQGNLNLWECKEYTIGIRSWSESNGYKVQAIVWYYLKKASRDELLEYAVKHPRNQDMFRYALRGTTVEPTEAEG